MGLPSRQAIIGPLLTAVLAAAPALSDEIHLKGGGRVSGRIVERTATRVAIETGPGRVTLPLSRVERIVEGRSALEVFAERAADLDAGDVAGWAELAHWAEERDLLTQARSAWQRVLATDPGHAEANAGLGRVPVDGVWMSAEDAYSARGYVSYEGRWLTPAEHEAAVREREADEAAALGRREADLRVQEAEARVREAEARAREAEAAAEGTSAGIPIGYGYGYGYGFGGVVPPYLPAHHPPRASRHPGSRRPGSHPGSPNVRPTPAPKPMPVARPQTRPTQPPQRRQAGILLPQPVPTSKR
jgi:hypothetical protein